MPIYEYECKKCGHHMEAFQRFSDSPLTKCESCRGKLRKLISQSTFHLKGSGWYVTDYASKSVNQGKESNPETKSASSGSTETKSASNGSTETKKASSGSTETKKAAKTKDASSKKTTDN